MGKIGRKKKAERRELKNRLYKAGNFYCPLCLNWFPPDLLHGRRAIASLEHVPPDGLDGKVLCLTCLDCNNGMGSKYDGPAIKEYKSSVRSDFFPGGRRNYSSTYIADKMNSEYVSFRFKPDNRSDFSWIKSAYLAIFAITGGTIHSPALKEMVFPLLKLFADRNLDAIPSFVSSPKNEYGIYLIVDPFLAWAVEFREKAVVLPMSSENHLDHLQDSSGCNAIPLSSGIVRFDQPRCFIAEDGELRLISKDAKQDEYIGHFHYGRNR